MRSARRFLARLCLTGLGLAALAGCSGRGLDVEGEAFPAVKPILAARQEALAVPRYLALARADAPGTIAFVEQRGAIDLLRRERVSADGVQSWLSQDGSLFAFRDGMLIATRGLGADLMSADAGASLALIRTRTPGQATRYMSTLDGDHTIEPQVYQCDITDDGPFRLDLTHTVVQTRIMVETCYGTRLNFQNLYWVDGAGEIRQSRQYVGTLTGLVSFRPVDTETARNMSRGIPGLRPMDAAPGSSTSGSTPAEAQP